MSDSRTGVYIHPVTVSQTSVMLELLSVHDVPVNLVTVIAHSCHIGSRCQVKCCEQSVNYRPDSSQNQWIRQ
eukprot:2256882-Amphidinium_carterae.1